jgi:hypothetical protein
MGDTFAELGDAASDEADLLAAARTHDRQHHPVFLR